MPLGIEVEAFMGKLKTNGETIFSVLVQQVKEGTGSIANAVPQMLAFVSELDEPAALKECKAQASAVAAYLAQRHDSSVEEWNAAQMVKMKVEHRLGEVLKATVRHRGRNSSCDGMSPEVFADDKGRKQSSRAQALAAIPWEMIESRVEVRTAKNEKVSQSGIVKELLRNLRSEEEPQDTCTVSALQTLIDLSRVFGCIYADPPWRYGNQGTRAATDNHYQTMAVEDIAALPIAKLAAEKAHLHLWTTNAFLREAFDIIDAWGFEYKSCFVWVKPQMGIGNYWRVSHEFMLLGVRGGCEFREHEHKSWLEQDRTGHSRKPYDVRRTIEKVSPGPRLELFGREPADGWVVWGNQIQRGVFDHSIIDLDKEQS